MQELKQILREYEIVLVNMQKVIEKSTDVQSNINTINISNFSTIVNGVSNCINLNNNSYAYIAGGCNNSVLGNSNIFVLGSNIKTSLGNFTYVNNLSATGNIQNTEHYRSPTTNSYDKCIRELSSKFPPEIIEKAIMAIDKHDQIILMNQLILSNLTKLKITL
jgi:hypothetical protein